VGFGVGVGVGVGVGQGVGVAVGTGVGVGVGVGGGGRTAVGVGVGAGVGVGVGAGTRAALGVGDGVTVALAGTAVAMPPSTVAGTLMSHVSRTQPTTAMNAASAMAMAVRVRSISEIIVYASRGAKGVSLSPGEYPRSIVGAELKVGPLAGLGRRRRRSPSAR
jgi:hypothetical protein